MAPRQTVFMVVRRLRGASRRFKARVSRFRVTALLIALVVLLLIRGAPLPPAAASDNGAFDESWNRVAAQSAAPSSVESLASTGLGHTRMFFDALGDASRLDIDGVMVGIDDGAGLLGFVIKMNPPFWGFAQDDTLMILMTTASHPDVEDTIVLRVDYDSSVGYYYYVQDYTRPLGGQPRVYLAYGNVDLSDGYIILAASLNDIPIHHQFFFAIATGNKGGALYDTAPNVGLFEYIDPDLVPITTLPPTTTTTLPPTTTTTAPPTTTTTLAPTTTTTTFPAPVFTDVGAAHPYYAAIAGMRQAGIIDGYPVNGTWEFRPGNLVWRAQFAKMICGVLGIPVSESLVAPFSDLGQDDPGTLYPHDYIAAAASYGITNGTAPGLFSPWADITRAQVVTMIVRGAQSLNPGALATPPAGYTGTISSFSDVHAPNMRMAEYNGLTAGLVGFGPSWDPWAKATRGEVAQVLWNLEQR